MKKVACFSISLLLFFSLFAQHVHDTNSAGIKKITTKRVEYKIGLHDTIRRIGFISETRYDRNGNITIITSHEMSPNLPFDTTRFVITNTPTEKKVKEFSDPNSYELKTFNANGQLIRLQNFSDGKFQSDWNYDYDAGGKLLAYYAKTVDGKKIMNEKREYDIQGRINFITQYLTDGRVMDSTAYIYSGKIATAKYFESGHRLSGYKIFCPYDSLITSVFYQPADTAPGINGYVIIPACVGDSVSILRDSIGNALMMFEKRRVRVDHRCSDYFTYTYYKNNLPTESVEIHNDTTKRETWTYNEKHERLNHKNYYPPDLSSTPESAQVYFYNSHGDIVETDNYWHGKLTYSWICKIEYY